MSNLEYFIQQANWVWGQNKDIHKPTRSQTFLSQCTFTGNRNKPRKKKWHPGTGNWERWRVLGSQLRDFPEQ